MSELKRIPTLPPPPDRTTSNNLTAGTAYARRKRRELRLAKSKKQQQQDGSGASATVTGISKRKKKMKTGANNTTLGLELVASPDLLAKHSGEWLDNDMEEKQHQHQQGPKLVSPEKQSTNRSQYSSTTRPNANEANKAVVTPEQPEKSSRSRLKLRNRLVGGASSSNSSNGGNNAASELYAAFNNPPKDEEQKDGGHNIASSSAAMDGKAATGNDGALGQGPVVGGSSREQQGGVTSLSSYRNLSRGRSRSSALPKMRRIGASQRDTPSASSKTINNNAPTSSSTALLPSSQQQQQPDNNNNTASIAAAAVAVATKKATSSRESSMKRIANAKAAAANQKRMQQQLRARSVERKRNQSLERDGVDAGQDTGVDTSREHQVHQQQHQVQSQRYQHQQHQVEMSIPQLKWLDEEIERRSQSQPRSARPKEEDVFGDLDEPFDEKDGHIAGGNAAMIATAATAAATSAQMGELPDQNTRDYLKTTGLESVRAARSGRVRSFFSNRRSMSTGKAGRKSGASAKQQMNKATTAMDQDSAKDENNQDNNSDDYEGLATPARSNRSSDVAANDGGGAGGGGSSTRKGVASFLRVRSFKSKDSANKNSPSAKKSVDGTPSSASTDSSSVDPVAKDEHTTSPEVENLQPVLEDEEVSHPVDEVPATPISILKPPNTTNTSNISNIKLPSPAMVRDRRAKMIVQERMASMQEEAKQKQIRRDNLRIKQQELEQQRAELERVDLIQHQQQQVVVEQGKRVTFQEGGSNNNNGDDTSTPSPQPHQHMMMEQQQRNITPSPTSNIPDPTIRDYFCKPTVSSSVIHNNGGPQQQQQQQQQQQFVAASSCLAIPVMNGMTLPAPVGSAGDHPTIGIVATTKGGGGNGVASSSAVESGVLTPTTPAVPMKRVVTNDSPTGVEEVVTSTSFTDEDGSVVGSVTVSVTSGNGNTTKKEEKSKPSPSKSVESWNSEDTEVTCNTTSNSTATGVNASMEWRKVRGVASPMVAESTKRKKDMALEMKYRDTQYGNNGSNDLDLEDIASDLMCYDNDNFSWLVNCWRSPTKTKKKKSAEEVIKDEAAVDDIIKVALSKKSTLPAKFDQATASADNSNEDNLAPSRPLFNALWDKRESETDASVGDKKEKPAGTILNNSLNTSKVELELDDGKHQLKIVPKSRPKTGSEGQEKDDAALPRSSKDSGSPGSDDVVRSYQSLSPQARKLLQELSPSTPLDVGDDGTGERATELQPPEIKRNIRPVALFKGRKKKQNEDDDDDDDGSMSQTLISEFREEYMEDNRSIDSSHFDASTLDHTLEANDRIVETNDDTLNTYSTTLKADGEDKTDTSEESTGCNAIPSVMSSWMDLNGVLDVVDKIDDAINGRICKDEFSDSDSDDDTIEDEDLRGGKPKNSRQYVSTRRSKQMREQRDRRKKRLDKARKHRINRHRSSEESVRSLPQTLADNIVSEGETAGETGGETGGETEDDQSKERRYAVRFSPGTIVDESDNDNETDGEDNGFRDEVDKEEDESTMDGKSSRSITPVSMTSVSTKSSTVRSNTPSSFQTFDTFSTGRSTPTASSSTVDIDDNVDHDNADDMDDVDLDVHISRALANASRGEKELDESNAESQDEREDSFDVVHNLGESPPTSYGGAVISTIGNVVPSLRLPAVQEDVTTSFAGAPNLSGSAKSGEFILESSTVAPKSDSDSTRSKSSGMVPKRMERISHTLKHKSLSLRVLKRDKGGNKQHAGSNSVTEGSMKSGSTKSNQGSTKSSPFF